jgi:preprotein translocase subunit YajC
MPQAGQSNVALLNIMFPLLLFAVIYFLIFRPQQTREKDHQKLLKNLNKNDEVVTSAGIHGTIVNIKDRTVTLRIDDNVKIEVEKNSIAYVKKEESFEKKA